MTVLTLTSTDPLLHVLGPVAAAAAAGTSLIVDLDPAAGWPFQVGSLRDLVRLGPSRTDLHPAREGVAILGGDVGDEPAEAVVAALCATWPHVVVRSCPPAGHAVSIGPAFPWGPACDVAVATRLGTRSKPLIPRPPSALVRRILRGEVDPRWRWFRHWRPIWETVA